MNIKAIKYSVIMPLLAVMVATMSSCLKNDIPYPTIEAQFLGITVDGQSAPPTIDPKTRTVTIHLSEQVDIKRVNITDYKVTEGAELSGDIMGLIDLSRDCVVTLSIYQDYTWRITASQPIERYFSVEGQVGESVIDEKARRVVAYVPEKLGKKAVKVTGMKLGPAEITTMEPDLVGQTADFSSPKRVVVKYHDYEWQWMVFVETTDVAVDISRVDAWTNVAWAYGTAQEGKDNGFEYRKQGAEQWTKVPSAWLTVSGGSFSACIRNLEAGTAYEVRAYSDTDYSAPLSVVTDGILTLPNMSFDDWWLDGKVWCPWAEGGSSTWDTGNKGATTLGDSNSCPSDDTWDGKPGRSAELNTKFVGIGIVGKLAAGNIFTGEYRKTDGTNGILGFGRPFTGRPTRMKGHFKYTCAKISDSSDDNYKHLIGQPDTAAIFVALTNWSEPYEIRTRPTNRQLFDKNADYVIAYGELLCGYTVENWTDFTIELDYRRTNERPTHIIIVASASKYGDFFTGGDGSTLCIDDFSFEWDY